MAVANIMSYPTYLRCMLQEDGYVNLFYLEKPKEIYSVFVENVREPSNQFDLTGTPLEIDLQDDDLHTELELSPKANNWTIDEESHYPVHLQDARELLNMYLKEKMFHDGKVDSNVSFCVCDGDDDQNIVLLGAGAGGRLFTRIQVCAKGFFKQEDRRMQITHMINVHQNNADGLINPEMEYYTSWTYNLNPKAASLDSDGRTVTMHISSNNINIINHQSIVNLSFKLATNNISSYLFMFWEDLKLIKDFIQIAKIADIHENIEVSKDPVNSNKLIQQIAAELNKLSLGDGCKGETDINDLNKSENKYFLYNLWDLFKNCKNIRDLKTCFTYFFTEVGYIQNIQDYLPENDKTDVGILIEGILEHTIPVLNINETFAMQLLVNFGLEKLKNEYFSIIARFSRMSGFLKIWDSVTENLRKEDTRLKRHFTVPTLTKCAASEMENSLLSLFKLHISAEFLLLKADYCEFPEELSQSIAMEMIEQYLNSNSINNLSCVTKDALYEFNTTINYTPPNINGNLIMWFLKQTSKSKKATVTTTFNKTKSPLFPPNIFSDYGIPTDVAEEMVDCYYLTELVKYTDTF